MIDAKTRIRRNTDVAAHELGGTEGGVLLHLKSGQYHGVDTVGWAIWSLLDGSRSVADLAGELRRQFPDAPDRLSDDVTSFLQDLLERDLVQIHDAAPET
jgi:hypothetical protein